MALISTAQSFGRRSNNGRGCNRLDGNMIRFANSYEKNKGTNGVDRHNIRIVIGGKLAKKARLISGDKVDFLFDGENGIAVLRRIPVGSDGFTLYYSGGAKASKRSGNLTMKVSYRKGMPRPSQNSIDAEASIDDNGDVFFYFDKSVVYE
jgi:hypothetical protein